MKTVILSCVLSLGLFLSLNHAYADAKFERLSFSSKHGKFSIKRSGSSYYLGRKKVKIQPILQFLPLLQLEPETACNPAIGSPDLTIVAKYKGHTFKKDFFVAEKTLKGKTGCTDFTGQGVYHLPMSKNWFLDQNLNTSLKFGKTLSFKQNGKTKFTLVKRKNTWISDTEDFFLNSERFKQVIGSIETIKPSYYLNYFFAEGRPRFEIMSASHSYQFVQIRESVWAYVSPEKDRLIVSESLGLLRPLDHGDWADIKSGSINNYLDTSLPLEARKEALAGLGTYWSQSLELALHQSIVDEKFPAELKIQALSLIRRHPSDDNMIALGKALDKAKTREVVFQIIEILKIRNPKGRDKNIDVDLESEKDAEIIQYWQNFVRKKFKK